MRSKRMRKRTSGALTCSARSAKRMDEAQGSKTKAERAGGEASEPTPYGALSPTIIVPVGMTAGPANGDRMGTE
jgi:hypothetical protein